MNARPCLLVALLSTGLSFGCGGEPPEQEPLGSTRQALDICDEAVPADHYVDGIPAYAQCDLTTGEVWSNNGVDTSTTSLGSDWVRTQRSGGYQCTELAYRYLYFRWDIDYRGGNGGEWCDGSLPGTLVANSSPVHGDLVVFAPGACGADAVYGHVAVVDTVDAAASEVTFVEQNRANRRTCRINTATCFLHAVANDGQVGAGGAGGAGGASGDGGSGGSTAPSCTDGVQNQDETGADCGGSVCQPCAAGATCVVSADCSSGICESGTCVCGVGLTACAGACVDVSLDAANCGDCGSPCAVGTVCSFGVCGGAGGSAGAATTPGASGTESGGAPAVGSGGTGAGAGGSGGSGGPLDTGGTAPETQAADPGGDESSCGCIAAGSTPRRAAPWVLMGATLLLLRRRRARGAR